MHALPSENPELIPRRHATRQTENLRLFGVAGIPRRTLPRASQTRYLTRISQYTP